MAEPEAAQVPVTFEDVAVYFSEDEWEMLAEWQKELYKETMKENYETLLAMSSSSEKPSLLAKIEQEEDPCVSNQQDLRDRIRPKRSWRGSARPEKMCSQAHCFSHRGSRAEEGQAGLLQDCWHTQCPGSY
ncbi:protein ZNF783 isoform X1 [Microcaecilia unicolor]|uniref:Protein ZNF783-like isoform X1 n=1 Tax=Microcaecilia unicolor TaxID=1415580 RepID=A0A6P7XD51_9AMPH|nr:protein ZNF783-like isoform X1 [Microcaecilia unicolor]